MPVNLQNGLLYNFLLKKCPWKNKVAREAWKKTHFCQWKKQTKTKKLPVKKQKIPVENFKKGQKNVREKKKTKLPVKNWKKRPKMAFTDIFFFTGKNINPGWRTPDLRTQFLNSWTYTQFWLKKGEGTQHEINGSCIICLHEYN